MQKVKKYRELVPLKAKSLRNLLMSNSFITGNNRGLGCLFHSLQSNLHELCVIHSKYVFHGRDLTKPIVYNHYT